MKLKEEEVSEIITKSQKALLHIQNNELTEVSIPILHFKFKEFPETKRTIFIVSYKKILLENGQRYWEFVDFKKEK